MDLTNEKQARRFLRAITMGFLGQHLLFTALFLSNGVWPLAVMNLFCALSASLSIRMLDRELMRAHIVTIHATELVCLGVFAVCVGQSAGFQLPLLGLTLFAFCAEYLGRTIQQKTLPALPFALADLAVYLVIFMPRFHEPGLLTLTPGSILSLQLTWSAVVFAVCVAGLSLIVQMNTDSERQLLDKAESDKLTGLYNRAGYDQLISNLDLSTTTLLLVDADKFKFVNDNYGHAVGDQVLKKIAWSLSQNFRRVDYVCRIGGDEFVVLMLNSPSLQTELLAGKINRINRELSHTTDDKLPLVSVSVGIAHGSEAEDWKDLFNHADAALYEVKENGRRGYRFYSK